MMKSRYAVPAAGSLHVGEGSNSCPAVHFPQDDELGQGPGKFLICWVQMTAESGKDCAQILCVYICTSRQGACPN
jgi:hypothetical protein